MSEPVEPDTEFTEDDLKGADVHPQPPGDDPPGDDEEPGKHQ
jgi:hypothetical protein